MGMIGAKRFTGRMPFLTPIIQSTLVNDNEALTWFRLWFRLNIMGSIHQNFGFGRNLKFIYSQVSVAAETVKIGIDPSLSFPQFNSKIRSKCAIILKPIYREIAKSWLNFISHMYVHKNSVTQFPISSFEYK